MTAPEQPAPDPAVAAAGQAERDTAATARRAAAGTPADPPATLPASQRSGGRVQR